MKEAGRKEDEGPRTGVEATQSGSIVMKKGLETMKATLKKAWLEDLMQFGKRQGGDTCEVTGHTLKLDGGRGILATVVALNTALRTERNLSGGTVPYAQSSATVSPRPISSSQRAASVKCTTSSCRHPHRPLPRGVFEGGGSREGRRSPRRR